MLVIALIVALVFRNSSRKIELFLRIGAAYILSFFLLRYGLDKLFMHQFYPPEPNTLHTPLGSLSKDILFWSSMGTSQTYNYFMGAIEVLPGIFLLFSRTRSFGAFIALGVLINVFAINVGFDITVKLLSGYLVIVAGYVLAPATPKISNAFFGTNFTIQKEENLRFQKPMIKSLLKWTFILFMTVELFYPYSRNTTKQSTLFGSYEVITPSEISLTDIGQARRIHIHSKGYFISESPTGKFQDHPVSIQQGKLIFTRDSLAMSYRHRENFVQLKWPIKGDSSGVILLRKINLDKLPARQDGFHWTIESLIESATSK